MRAIVSVSDKAGVTDFAKGLSELGFDVFSTGGTKKALTEAGVPVKSVSEITGFPEILDGRGNSWLQPESWLVHRCQCSPAPRQGQPPPWIQSAQRDRD